MSYKPISKYEEHAKNPFMKSFLMKSRKRFRMIRDGNKVIYDRKTGEEDETFVMGTFEKVDKERFTKLFLDYIKVIHQLGLTDVKVLTYIMSVLEMNSDRVSINYRDCSEFIAITSRTSIITALSNLVEAKIIARTIVPFTFYIDPSIMFNGDRIKFEREFVQETTGLKLEPYPKRKRISAANKKEDDIVIPQSQKTYSNEE